MPKVAVASRADIRPTPRRRKSHISNSKTCVIQRQEPSTRAPQKLCSATLNCKANTFLFWSSNIDTSHTTIAFFPCIGSLLSIWIGRSPPFSHIYLLPQMRLRLAKLTIAQILFERVARACVSAKQFRSHRALNQLYSLNKWARKQTFFIPLSSCFD
jgi:hypothetical protein